MNRSIIKDVVLNTSKTLDSFNVTVEDVDLETSRAVLVTAGTAVALVTVARTRYAGIIVTAGLILAGVNYINHRFGISNKVKLKRCE